MKAKKTKAILFLSAFFYAIQFYMNNKITPVGDQIAFLKYAKELIEKGEAYYCFCTGV